MRNKGFDVQRLIKPLGKQLPPDTLYCARIVSCCVGRLRHSGRSLRGHAALVRMSVVRLRRYQRLHADQMASCVRSRRLDPDGRTTDSGRELTMSFMGGSGQLFR